MTKEEIALQLTLARLDKLTYTVHKSQDNFELNKQWNESIAEETVKIFNSIYNGILKD